MSDDESRHRSMPEETTPARSPEPEKPGADVSVEVERAARELQGGSLRAAFVLLGNDIDTLRVAAQHESGASKQHQSELDDIQQQHRLAMDELDQFESETAAEWESFRKRMKETQQHLQDRLDHIRRRFPDTD